MQYRGIEHITSNNREILVIDYRDSSEEEMISRMHNATEVMLSKTEPTYLMTIYNDKSYITPKYMRELEKATIEHPKLIKKLAVVGLNNVKKSILKGFNHRFSFNIRSFDTKDEAIAYLSSNQR